MPREARSMPAVRSIPAICHPDVSHVHPDIQTYFNGGFVTLPAASLVSTCECMGASCRSPLRDTNIPSKDLAATKQNVLRALLQNRDFIGRSEFLRKDPV
ncbi:hypothetical protein NDU88_008133 [Pleurodeles waltl]|uniref:Post-SET domain-containing protein n=1 Tax=Pleurodeles waltl TaxID=8319 RepID=A0AAV7N444_PLEWA|nr:hypothetical protein NDU88_008133 [Pleurodeles waltl]